MSRIQLASVLAPGLLLLGCGCGGEMADVGMAGGVPYAGEIDPQESYQEGEQYQDYGENPFIATTEDQLSTFSVDVDTASYSIMRRDIERGQLPVAEGVRVEEYVNYFEYEGQPPRTDPFSVQLELAPSRFGEGLHLLRIGLKARTVPEEQRLPANLVFLLDVSGSMAAPNKLGLVKYALGHLLRKLQPNDTLSIVVYASREGVVLRPTSVCNKSAILDAIDGLQAGGSTAGEAGIRLAYRMAREGFREGGINRVVLCTDGDFNVGATGEELLSIIEDYREQGVFLSVLGFGMGNYNDATMEQLADRGNGNYAYIDSPNEALRVLGEKLVGTLQVVAKDVKVQVEFATEQVRRFRLIGYENRVLEHEDFDDDQVDAGDIGAGHYVTAFYELELTEAPAGRVATVRLRYKEPEGAESRLLEQGFERDAALAQFEQSSASFRFGAAVAEFAEILRHSSHSEGRRFDEVLRVAQGALGPGEPTSDRLEFLELVRKAQAIRVGH